MNGIEEVRSWASLLRSSKTSTLKFAVARAIIDEVCEATTQDEVVISRSRLAYRLVSYYWYQVRQFRLKQAAADIQEPNVVRSLREIDGAADCRWRPGRSDVQPIVEFVAEEGLREVIPRFHNGIEGQLFRVEPRAALSITEGQRKFVSSFGPLLMKSVLAGWAEQIEQYNLTPRALAKVSFDGRRRTSVSKWSQALRDIDDACFYCRVANPAIVQVDHVVPWSFIFDDAPWNLVLACDRCNNSKRDRIPAQRFLRALCERNSRLSGEKSASFAQRVSFSMTQLPHGGEAGLQKSLTMLCEQALLQGFVSGWSPAPSAEARRAR